MSILEILDAACKHLSVEDRGVLVTAILDDMHGVQPVFESQVAEYAFKTYKYAISTEEERKEAAAQAHRKCGRLGGRPRKSEDPKNLKNQIGYLGFSEKPNNIEDYFTLSSEFTESQSNSETDSVSEENQNNLNNQFGFFGLSDIKEDFICSLEETETHIDSTENSINADAVNAILNSSFEKEQEEKKKSDIKENKEEREKERNKKETETIVSVKKKKKATKKISPEAFEPPTVEQVAEYCGHRGNSIDAEYFVAFYNARGWIAGESQTPITDWKAQIIIWEKNNITQERNGNRHSTTYQNGNLDNREREYESSF